MFILVCATSVWHFPPPTSRIVSLFEIHIHDVHVLDLGCEIVLWLTCGVKIILRDELLLLTIDLDI